MFNSLNDIRKITDKTKGKVLGWTISYMIAKLVELVESNSSIDGLWEQRFALLNISKPSNAMLWIGAVLSVLLYLANWIATVFAKRENPSINFRKIMREHTAEEIQEISDKSFSWGYNYCIHYSRDPRGWAPSAFFISDYIEEEYTFPKKVVGLPDYNKDSYNTYCSENPEIEAIRRKGEDRERFAVNHIKHNFDRNRPRIDIKLEKTSWVQLQYSWDYFRLLNAKDNSKVEGKSNQVEIENALYRAFENQGNEFYINSFCLHLIIETKKGVILSRIGQSKQNDYASTWAATIGEQIEKRDFQIITNDERKFHDDFVERWTRRALEEEFGVVGEEMYEEIVEANSLKVLSVDMEADIYNVALTCVIRFKMSLDEFLKEYRSSIDRLENYEQKECNLEEVRDILLRYPKNQAEYHPSTYLRLLMYHRYKEGTNKTNELLYRDYKNKIV